MLSKNRRALHNLCSFQARGAWKLALPLLAFDCAAPSNSGAATETTQGETSVPVPMESSPGSPSSTVPAASTPQTEPSPEPNVVATPTTPPSNPTASTSTATPSTEPSAPQGSSTSNPEPVGGTGGGGLANSGGSGPEPQSGGSGGNSTAGVGGVAPVSSGGAAGNPPVAGLYPEASATLAALRLANAWFMERHPDPGALAPGNRTSNLWTRGVYYEGLLALYALDQDPSFKEYAINWGEAHNWGLRAGVQSEDADSHCAGQAYIDLYELDGRMNPERIADIQASIDLMVAAQATDAWTWIDAIQMAMPVFTRLGVLSGDTAYFDTMWDLYSHTRDTEGDGLFNEQSGLWWRDANYSPGGTYTRSPNDIDIYWSRGNGWVIAALVRVLEWLPTSDPHREQYIADLQAMAAALLPLQREDGYWNSSLLDPLHCAAKGLPEEDGPETSGTALFVYGLGWGIRNGFLAESEYGPAVRRGWAALSEDALQEDGLLGNVQSTGAEPCDPEGARGLGPEVVPDFDDYGLGCFLLAGSEVALLAEAVP